jgi:hypothetical protein
MNCLGLFLAVSMHMGLEANYNNIHPHARCTIDENTTAKKITVWSLVGNSASEDENIRNKLHEPRCRDGNCGIR